MNSYSLQLKSIGSQATSFQVIENCGHHSEACEIAFATAKSWGRGNGSTAVKYTVSLGSDECDVWEAVVDILPRIPQFKPSPLTSVTISIDSKDKFFAVLEALQQYVDNCDDHIEAQKDYGDQDAVRDLAAKSNAAGEIRDQLEAVLTSLAG
jgi:hypothetical protein